MNKTNVSFYKVLLTEHLEEQVGTGIKFLLGANDPDTTLSETIREYFEPRNFSINTLNMLIAGGLIKSVSNKITGTKESLESVNRKVVKNYFKKEFDKNPDKVINNHIDKDNYEQKLDVLDETKIQELATGIYNKEDNLSKERYNKTIDNIKQDLINSNIKEQEADKYIKTLNSIHGGLAFNMGVSRYDVANKIRLKIKKVKENNNDINNDAFYQSAAMYKAPQENISEFVNDVLKGDLEKKKYFEYKTNNGINLKIPSDTIIHDSRKHNLTSEDWNNLLNNFDNIKDAIETTKNTSNGDQHVLLKIKTDNGLYGVAISTNNNTITTAFKSTDKGIDAWMNKATAMATAPHPRSGSSVIQDNNVSYSQSLDDIINKLKSKVNTQNETYYQAINNDLNLNQEVNILSIKNLLKDNKNTTKADAKKVIEEIANSGEQIETLSEPWVMDILNSNKKKSHLLNSNKYGKFKPNEYYRHNIELNNLKDIINNSVLIERVDNIKTDKKPNIEEYFYFYTPITDGKNIYLVKSVAEKLKGEKDLKNVHLYDMFDYQIKTVPQTDEPFLGGSLSSPDAFTIKDILSNVKDFYGNNAYDSYITENQDLLLKQNNQDTIKGFIELGNTKAIINLISGKYDQSTVLHELAHYYLKLIEEFDKDGYVMASNMLEEVKEFTATFDNKIGTQTHERFARAFEQYIRSGKYNNNFLKEVFDYFKSFLESIYKTSSELGIDNSKMYEFFDKYLYHPENYNNWVYGDDDEEKILNER